MYKFTFSLVHLIGIQAAGPLHCDNLTLIAFSPTRDVVIGGKAIHIVSAIEWLLS